MKMQNVNSDLASYLGQQLNAWLHTNLYVVFFKNVVMSYYPGNLRFSITKKFVKMLKLVTTNQYIF